MTHYFSNYILGLLPNVYSNEEEFMTCTLGSLSASIFGGSASIELLLCKQRRLAVNVCGC